MTNESKMTPEQINEKIALLEKVERATLTGDSLIPYTEYIQLFNELQKIAPEHPFFQPESCDKRKVELSTPFLHIPQMYTAAELQSFIERAHRSAKEVGITELIFRMMPRFDGIRARDENNMLITKGSGRYGRNVTHLLQWGLKIIGGRNLGQGQIVLLQSHFEQHCKAEHPSPRQVIMAAVGSEVLPPIAEQALSTGSLHFVPDVTLIDNCWKGTGREVLAQWSSILQQFTEQSDYMLEGLMLEVIDPKIREHLGSTPSYERWNAIIKTPAH